MTDYEKLVKLLNEKFNEMNFSKTERLEDNASHLVDKTGEMFAHFRRKYSRNSFGSKFY